MLVLQSWLSFKVSTLAECMCRYIWPSWSICGWYTYWCIIDPTYCEEKGLVTLGQSLVHWWSVEEFRHANKIAGLHYLWTFQCQHMQHTWLCKVLWYTYITMPHAYATADSVHNQDNVHQTLFLARGGFWGRDWMVSLAKKKCACMYARSQDACPKRSSLPSDTSIMWEM